MNSSLVYEILKSDHDRMRILSYVKNLNLNDSWIGGGFVRNAIWDYVHGIRTPLGEFDIDIIYYDKQDLDPEFDLELEQKLLACDHKQKWSVKNQARMHERNRDEPYTDCADAISKWPETATAIAIRINDFDELELLAPFGCADIFNLNIQPTPHFQKKISIVQDRIKNKNWLLIWPKLNIILNP